VVSTHWKQITLPIRICVLRGKINQLTFVVAFYLCLPILSRQPPVQTEVSNLVIYQALTRAPFNPFQSPLVVLLFWTISFGVEFHFMWFWCDKNCIDLLLITHLITRCCYFRQQTPQAISVGSAAVRIVAFNLGVIEMASIFTPRRLDETKIVTNSRNYSTWSVDDPIITNIHHDQSVSIHQWSENVTSFSSHLERQFSRLNCPSFGGSDLECPTIHYDESGSSLTSTIDHSNRYNTSSRDEKWTLNLRPVLPIDWITFLRLQCLPTTSAWLESVG